MPTLTWTIHNQPYTPQTQRRSASVDTLDIEMSGEEIVYKLISIVTRALMPFEEARLAVTQAIAELLPASGHEAG